MASFWRTVRGWFHGLYLPPPSREQVAAGSTSAARPAAAPAEFPAWKDLALVLFSGRAPAGLEVVGSLSLAKLRLRSLPAGMIVRGDLDLRQCQRLNAIGDGLTVSGDLLIGGRCHDTPWWESVVLRDTLGQAGLPAVLRTSSRDGQCPLPALPGDLRVGRDLALRQCRRLERLPGDVQVGRSILLGGCTAMASLPDPLDVRGDLTISAAPNLARLPARLRVRGNLRLSGVAIARLPEGFRVGGDLVVECCPRLVSLPEGLHVGGSLIIRRCPIARLPSGLHVGRDLRLHHLPHLAELPAGISVPGRVELIGCPSLRRMPPGLRVATDLIVRRCEGLRELPEGLHVPRTLDLRGCRRLEALPAGMHVGSALGPLAFVPALRLADCSSLTTLPDDLVLGGPIELAGSGLQDLPDRLARSARLLWRGVVVPPEVVFRPETLSPQEILGQRNAELRRVMLERVGLDRVLREARAEVVDSDRDSGGERRLLQVRLPDGRGRVQPRRYLHCRCPSTGRDYLLRLPPEVATCRAAAAWLAGFDDPEAYRPIVET